MPSVDILATANHAEPSLSAVRVPRHFSPLDHRQFTLRENQPHKFRESPGPQGWIDRKAPWKISGSGCAWVFGLAIWLRVGRCGLKMSAQQEWAGIAIDDRIRPDAGLPEIVQKPPRGIRDADC